MDRAGGIPPAWRTGVPRQELASAFAVDPSVSHPGRASARTTAHGNPGTFGYWSTIVQGIRTGTDTGSEDGLVTADIDLDTRTFERWLSVAGYGEWKNLYPKERRSETYRGLMKGQNE